MTFEEASITFEKNNEHFLKYRFIRQYLFIHLLEKCNPQLVLKLSPLFAFESNLYNICDSENVWKVIACLSGRFDVLVQKIRCCNCSKTIDSLDINTVIQNGYWPSSLVNISCIYDVELLHFWGLLQKIQPRCSEASFLKTLSQISEKNARVKYSIGCRYDIFFGNFW